MSTSSFSLRRVTRFVSLLFVFFAAMIFLLAGSCPAHAQRGGQPNVSIILQDAYIEIGTDGNIHGKDLGTYSGNHAPPNSSVIQAKLLIDGVVVAATEVPVGYHYNTIVSLDLMYPLSALSSGTHTITWMGTGMGRAQNGAIITFIGNQTLWYLTGTVNIP